MPELFALRKDTKSEFQESNLSVSDQRDIYSEIFEKYTTVQNAVRTISLIAELENRKLSPEPTPPSPGNETLSLELSASTLDHFSSKLENVLKAWNFPDASRVHFERTERDFVISGKPRGSRGKGMRAITHAAFTITLMEFTRSNELFHPGLVILDTPLLGISRARR